MRSPHVLGEAKIAGVVVLVIVMNVAGRGAMTNKEVVKEIVAHVTSLLCGTATTETMTETTEPAADVESPRRGPRRQDVDRLHRLRRQDRRRQRGAHRLLLPAVRRHLVSSKRMSSRMRTAMM